MKISEKLENLKIKKIEVCDQLKEEIKLLNNEDSKLQEALLSIWADINNQIEEMELMIEGLEVVSR